MIGTQFGVVGNVIKIMLLKLIRGQAMKIVNAIFVVIFLFGSPQAISGTFIVYDGTTIKAVSNTSANAANFRVVTEGGSGVCAGKEILFPEQDAANSNAHQRAYSTALTALSTGMRVRIHNYSSDPCDRASYIEVTK